MAKRSKNILGGAGFYAVLLLCLAAVGVTSWFCLFRSKSPAADSSEQPPAQEEVTAQAPELKDPAAEAASSAEIALPEETAAQPVDMPEETVDDTPVVAQAPNLIVSPLKGQVLEAFSVDQLVYDKTLEDWRTHSGVDIAAAQGTNVLAACAGTVESVSADPMMGTTVVLSHSGGYQTTYANLQASPTVKAGDDVSAGQVIGSVGTTAIAESAEGPHLHFGVTKDGDVMDPDEFLNS